MIAFVIWSICACIFVVLGIWSWKSKKEVGFFSGVKPPKMKDVAVYNRAVGKIWIVFAVIFEILGIPVAFYPQNSPIFIFVIIGVMALIIGIIIAYLKVEKKYREE